MFVRDDSLAKTRIELFTTSTASDIKTKKDCYRLRALLEAKKIDFTEASTLHVVQDLAATHLLNDSYRLVKDLLKDIFYKGSVSKNFVAYAD